MASDGVSHFEQAGKHSLAHGVQGTYTRAWKGQENAQGVHGFSMVCEQVQVD